MQSLSRNSQRLCLKLAFLLLTIGTSIPHLAAQLPQSKGQEAQALQAEPSQEAQAMQAEPRQEAQAIQAEPLQEAQALQALPRPEPTPATHKHRIPQHPQALPTATMGLHPHRQTHLNPDKALGVNWERHFAPQKPNRPIPVVLVVLGVLMVLFWSGLLVGAMLATALLGTLLLIAAIVFSPILIFGIIFLIGGISASSSPSKK